MTEKLKLPVEALTPNVEPRRLGFTDTSELPPLEEPIGQERAVEALEFGLRMQSPGFNIYVSGPIGSGKWSIAKEMVKRLARSAPPPADWCYVNNFQDPSRPRCLSFPATQGRVFKQAMAGLIEGLRRDIPMDVYIVLNLTRPPLLRSTLSRDQGTPQEPTTDLGRPRVAIDGRSRA